MTNIFTMCGPKEQKNFRLVSKLWNDVSLPIWRRSSVIALGNRKPLEHLELEDLILALNDQSTNTIESFVTAIRTQENYMRMPFLHFHLQGTSFEPAFMERWHHDKFFMLCAPKMKSLQFTGCYFLGHRFFFRTLLEHDRLEKLVLKDVIIHIDFEDNGDFDLRGLPRILPFESTTKLRVLNSMEIFGGNDILIIPFPVFGQLFKLTPNLEVNQESKC